MSARIVPCEPHVTGESAPLDPPLNMMSFMISVKFLLLSDTQILSGSLGSIGLGQYKICINHPTSKIFAVECKRDNFTVILIHPIFTSSRSCRL